MSKVWLFISATISNPPFGLSIQSVKNEFRVILLIPNFALTSCQESIQLRSLTLIFSYLILNVQQLGAEYLSSRHTLIGFVLLFFIFQTSIAFSASLQTRFGGRGDPSYNVTITPKGRSSYSLIRGSLYQKSLLRDNLISFSFVTKYGA